VHDLPFTPLHLGPGALFKAVGGRRFSFMIFGGSQVLMDIEPLIRMARHDGILHGTSHTVLGAFAVGIVAAAGGRPVSEFVLRLLRIPHHSLTWKVSFISAFIGTYSHILLDAVMHKDMSPLWPFMAGNTLLDVMPLLWLHILCVLSGLLGIAIILAKGGESPLP
jgi:membrane-bound metal-dependent hydrolase YbcI (DUF457 family)